MSKLEKPIIVANMYKGTDKVSAGLMYEFLKTKKDREEHMEMGTTERKVEIVITDVTMLEMKDKEHMTGTMYDTIYKVDVKANMVRFE